MRSNIVLFLLGLILGAFFCHLFYSRKNATVEDVSVVQERIEAVLKLTTVEGKFSEIYSYENYQGDYPSLFEKKAIVRVKATVAAGFDLKKMNFETNEATKTIRLTYPANASILSVDHYLDYYDITNGIFTDFSRADHNLMQSRAKQFIREVAEKSDLIPEANAEGKKILEMLEFMVKGMGWNLILEPQSGLAQ